MTDDTETRPHVFHRGYKLVFSENEEVWTCWALDMDAAKLSALKAKVDKYEAALRRLSIPVIALDTHWEKVGVRGVVTLRVGDENIPAWRKQHGDSNLIEVYMIREVPAHKGAWGGTVPASTERKKVSIKSLAPDTTEAMEAIERWRALKAKADKAAEAAKAAFAAIPRVTEDMVTPAAPERVGQDEPGVGPS